MPDQLPLIPIDPFTHDFNMTQKRLKADVDLDRHQRRIIFYLVVAALIVATLGSAYLSFIVAATDLNHADKEWARSTLASVIAGMVGYAFGKK